MTDGQEMRKAFHKMTRNLGISDNLKKVREAEVIWDAAIKVLSCLKSSQGRRA